NDKYVHNVALINWVLDNEIIKHTTTKSSPSDTVLDVFCILNAIECGDEGVISKILKLLVSYPPINRDIDKSLIGKVIAQNKRTLDLFIEAGISCTGDTSSLILACATETEDVDLLQRLVKLGVEIEAGLM